MFFELYNSHVEQNFGGSNVGYVFVIMLNFRYILILLVFCTVNQPVKINFELIEMLVFNLTKSTLIFTGQTHTVRKDNI